MRQHLSFDTVGQLDGGIARRLIDAEIDRAVADLIDRGEEDGKGRTVQIQLDLSLVNGLVTVDVQAKAKLPPRRTKSTAARPSRLGDKDVLLFQDLPDTHPDQGSLDDHLPRVRALAGD